MRSSKNFVFVGVLLLNSCGGNSETAENAVYSPSDSTAPTLAVITAVPSATTDTTPSFTFSSSESGTIGWWGIRRRQAIRLDRPRWNLYLASCVFGRFLGLLPQTRLGIIA